MMLHTLATECITAKTMVYNIWPQRVYNIESNVIHYGHRECITSKTMLYTIASCVHHTTQWTQTCITTRSDVRGRKDNLQKRWLAGEKGLQFSVQIKGHYSCTVDKHNNTYKPTNMKYKICMNSAYLF